MKLNAIKALLATALLTVSTQSSAEPLSSLIPGGDLSPVTIGAPAPVTIGAPVPVTIGAPVPGLITLEQVTQDIATHYDGDTTQLYANIDCIETSTPDACGLGYIDLSDMAIRFNAIAAAKEAAIRELQLNGDFDDPETVLLMQKMMNEWSFTLGLSSSLTKTIADALKGIVQKI